MPNFEPKITTKVKEGVTLASLTVTLISAISTGVILGIVIFSITSLLSGQGDFQIATITNLTNACFDEEGNLLQDSELIPCGVRCPDANNPNVVIIGIKCPPGFICKMISFLEYKCIRTTNSDTKVF